MPEKIVNLAQPSLFDASEVQTKRITRWEQLLQGLTLLANMRGFQVRILHHRANYIRFAVSGLFRLWEDSDEKRRQKQVYTATGDRQYSHRLKIAMAAILHSTGKMTYHDISEYFYQTEEKNVALLFWEFFLMKENEEGEG